MEPITLLAAALIAGHSALDEAGKDAYKALKSLISNMFQGDKSAERALEGHEENPDGYDPLLKKALESRKVRENPRRIELAKKVMEAKDPVCWPAQDARSRIASAPRPGRPPLPAALRCTWRL